MGGSQHEVNSAKQRVSAAEAPPSWPAGVAGGVESNMDRPDMAPLRSATLVTLKRYPLWSYPSKGANSRSVETEIAKVP
jgi:hypothetical protein